MQPVCMASIMKDLSEEHHAIYFSNPATANERTHMTVKKSIDNAETWPSELLVYDGAGAYSCLSTIDMEGYLGLLWESSASQCIGESCQMLFYSASTRLYRMGTTNT